MMRSSSPSRRSGRMSTRSPIKLKGPFGNHKPETPPVIEHPRESSGARPGLDLPRAERHVAARSRVSLPIPEAGKLRVRVCPETQPKPWRSTTTPAHAPGYLQLRKSRHRPDTGMATYHGGRVKRDLLNATRPGHLALTDWPAPVGRLDIPQVKSADPATTSLDRTTGFPLKRARLDNRTQACIRLRLSSLLDLRSPGAGAMSSKGERRLAQSSLNLWGVTPRPLPRWRTEPNTSLGAI
jgi:hypothetical protein